MNNSRSIAIAVILFSGLTVNAQKEKKEEKCAGDCCKEKTAKTKPETDIKQVAFMATTPKKKIVACKLTSPELQKRKQEVLASLKKKVISRDDLENGYKYKFDGSDQLLDEVITFIKSERACCDFFAFNISIADDKTNIWLSITGPDGAKEFIKMEMDL